MAKKLELRVGDAVVTLRLDPDLPVVINSDAQKGDTTTFHFAVDKRSICGRVTERRAREVRLADALNEPRRLCTKCASKMADWNEVALRLSAARGFVHPPK